MTIVLTYNYNHSHMSTQQDLYGKFHDVIILLSSINNKCTPCSAQDIKTVIAAKMKNKSKEPQLLQHLYTLENRIADLRTSLEEAKRTTIT